MTKEKVVTVVAMDVSLTNNGIFIARIDPSLKDPVKLVPVACRTVHTDHLLDRRKSAGGDDDITVVNRMRAEYLFKESVEFVLEHAGHPSLLVTELPNGGAHSAASMRALGIAVGVIGSIRVQLDCPTMNIKALDSKFKMTGHKDASKDTMITAARKAFPDYEFPTVKKEAEHICDAVAAMLTAYDEEIFRTLVTATEIRSGK